MKKNLLLLLSAVAFSAIAQTSIYHPFPENNATWNYNLTGNCFVGSMNEKYSITFSGDTIINNQTYHQLHTPFIESFSTGTCANLPTGYKGAIRQDVPLKKVYFIPVNDTLEYLLYDFNLSVGDTLTGYTQYLLGYRDIIVGMDSVLVGNTYHKRWKTNDPYNIYMIEGIGSTYGLIERSPGTMTDMADYSLTCFQSSIQGVYPDSLTACQVISSVPENNDNSNVLSVFPNPSKGSFTIDFENASTQEIRITDMTGKLILHQATLNQSQIKVSDLKSGTYILTVMDKEGNLTNKKIISCP
jgi:hypothetical protein